MCATRASGSHRTRSRRSSSGSRASIHRRRKTSRAPASACRSSVRPSSCTAARCGRRVSSAAARCSTSCCPLQARARRWRLESADAGSPRLSADLILLVDDEEQIRKLLESSLQRRGYEVAVATDGIEALRQIRTKMPDLIVTDVNMPNMNGFELTRRLRADHRTARVPIVMLSARKQADDILTGYAEGADEYIPKPVEMAVLSAKIEVLIKRFRATQGGSESAPKRGGNVILFLHGHAD